MNKISNTCSTSFGIVWNIKMIINIIHKYCVLIITTNNTAKFSNHVLHMLSICFA
jgi:hypothetical protein